MSLLHWRNSRLGDGETGALSSLKSFFYFFYFFQKQCIFPLNFKNQNWPCNLNNPLQFLPSRSYIFSPRKKEEKNGGPPLWHSRCLVQSAAAYLLTQIILLWIVLSSPVPARLMDEQVGQRRKAHLRSALFGTAVRSGPQEHARSPSG